MAVGTNYLQNLANQYYAKLQQGSSSSGLGSVINAKPTVNVPGPGAFSSRVEGAVGPNSTLGKIIDVVSRPLYGVANVAKNAVIDPTKDILTGSQNSSWVQANQRGDNIVNTVFNNTVGSALSGLSGRSKTLMSDAVLGDWKPQSTPEAILRFTSGLGLDIAGDPVTYVPGGAVVGIAKKVPGVAKGIEALKSAGTLAKDALPAAKELPAAAKTVEPVASEADTLAQMWSKFPKNIQDSVKAAANIPRTAQGKQIYDFKRLPNLYSKPAAPVSKGNTEKIAATIGDWIKQNRKATVVNDSEGKFVFGGKPTTDRTVGEVVSDAMQLRNAGDNATANSIMKDIERLFHESQGVSATGTRKTAASLVDHATAAASRSTGAARDARIQGAARRKVLDTLKSKLDPVDYTYLVGARSSATFNARRTEILSRALSPAKEIPFTTAAEAPEGTFLRTMLGETITPKEVPVGQVLNPTDPSVERAISKAADIQFKAKEHGYKYTSAVKGTARTNVKIGKGLGISDRGFNGRAQYHVWQGLVNDISAGLKKLGSKSPQGSARAEIIRKEILPKLDQADAVLRSRGIEPILGSSNDGIALSFGDVLHSLDLTQAGRDVLFHQILDRRAGALSLTNLGDAVDTLFEALKQHGVTNTAQLRDFLRTLKATAGDKNSLWSQIAWELTKDPGGSYSRTAEAVARRVAKGEPAINKGYTKLVKNPSAFHMVNGKRVRREGAAGRDLISVTLGGKELEAAVRKTMSALLNERSLREMVSRNLGNSARYNGQLAYQVKQISEPVIREFFDTWTKPTTSTGEAIRAYSNVDRAVNAAAISNDTTDVARRVASTITQSEIDDALAGDLPTLERINAITKAKTASDTLEAGTKLHTSLADEVIEALPETIDTGEQVGQVVSHYIVRAMFPFLTKSPENFFGRVGQSIDYGLTRFVPQAGHATLRPALSENTSVVRYIANSWRDKLTSIHRAFPSAEQLAPIFVQIQKGEKVAGSFTETQRRAIDLLEQQVKTIFEPNVTRGVAAPTDAFFRNAAQVEHVNAKLAASGLPEHMRFDPTNAIKVAAENGTSVKEELSRQWASWVVEDPIDFMAKMQHAVTSVHVDQAIAREAFRIAFSKNLASMSKRPGFVQIFDSTDKSVLTRYLPEGAWYHRDIVEEIKAMDSVLSQSLSFTSPFGQWVNKYLDPFLNMWKAGMTIYRPGHHVRNLIGDSSLAFLADGVGKPHQIKNTLKVMMMAGNYDDFSALRALQYGINDLGAGAKLDEAMLRRGSEVAAQITLKGGKKQSLTAKEVHDYIRSHGMLPDFVTGEDLFNLDKQSQTITAIKNSMSIANGKVRRAAGLTSESRDNFVRISHFLNIIEKETKFSSVNELMDYAVRRVRKWHPDGTDLTPFESKVMRRIFPFYSWTKKTVPLVVESMVQHPGRVMVWPKAMYNLAKASGVDPTSLADPFPQDQLFPSFLTDELTGPTSYINGHYYGFSPGLANVDIMNQFLGDPKAGILSMLSPFIKVPVELTTGKRIDTGSDIASSTEYLGSQIPGISQASSLTGTDLLGSALEGQGFQPLQSVQKGNRPQFDKTALYNYLLGLSIVDMSKPNYINYAEIEKRNAARRAANG